MMAAKPVICAFDAPDTLVRIYDCGYQCDPSNKEEVVEAITKLETMDPKDREEMGNRGKKAILSHFTYKQLAEDFIENI